MQDPQIVLAFIVLCAITGPAGLFLLSAPIRYRRRTVGRHPRGKAEQYIRHSTICVPSTRSLCDAPLPRFARTTDTAQIKVVAPPTLTDGIPVRPRPEKVLSPNARFVRDMVRESA